MLRNLNPINSLVKILNVVSVLVYSQIMIAGISRKLGKYTYPKRIELSVEDANEDICINFINKYKPEIIFIHGSSILQKQFLTKIKTLIINIHSGIVPMYRNVHSDFWAYINKDYQNIGVSLISLDQGIDSGNIVLQKTINFKREDKLIDVKIKILKLIPGLIEKIIKQNKDKKIILKKQDKKKIGFYKTPGLMDLIRLFV